MRVLCVADHVDPVVYSHAIKERFKDIALVIGCGDLPLDYYDFIASNLNKPLFFVFGNHNLTRIGEFDRRYRPGPEEIPPAYRERRPAGGQHIGGRVVTAKGLIVAGLGGSMYYNRGQNQFSNAGMFFYMLRLVPALIWHRLAHGRFLDLLVTHAPPAGIHDQRDMCHRGFKPFVWFMNVFKPKYLVHGHVHLYGNNGERRAEYRHTVVINAFDHYVIDTEEPREQIVGKPSPEPERAR
ncbi:MAG: metallophosphoesterase [Spirochaetales bacterium]|nr:metallophosphoesterase [Spirochaetales bacterium]